jgi:hypothetical protein
VFDKIGVSSRVELVPCALTSSMADHPSLAPHPDQAHPITVGLRRRHTMTNA